MAEIPTTELVATRWLAQRVTGLTSAMVATTLPADVETWRATGFVQVQALPSGLTDVDVPERRTPLLQIDTWAAPATAGSASPRWNLANKLAELLRAATEVQTYGAPVTMPAAYDGARVLAVYLQTDPRRFLDDLSGFARYTFDVSFDWVRNP